ncbi:unnamed protein product, partial [Allacma fusca]
MPSGSKIFAASEQIVHFETNSRIGGVLTLKQNLSTAGSQNK